MKNMAAIFCFLLAVYLQTDEADGQVQVSGYVNTFLIANASNGGEMYYSPSIANTSVFSSIPPVTLFTNLASIPWDQSSSDGVTTVQSKGTFTAEALPGGGMDLNVAFNDTVLAFPPLVGPVYSYGNTIIFVRLSVPTAYTLTMSSDISNDTGGEIETEIAPFSNLDAFNYTYDPGYPYGSNIRSSFTVTGILQPGDYTYQTMSNAYDPGAPNSQSVSNIGIEDLKLSPLPEPSTWSLKLAGMVTLAIFARRQHRVRVASQEYLSGTMMRSPGS